MSPNRNPRETECEILDTDAIPVMCLSFTPKQEQQVKEGLEDFGFTPDSEGLKKFILESMKPEKAPAYRGATERVLGKAVEYIANNPDAVRQGAQIINTSLRGMFGTPQKPRR